MAEGLETFRGKFFENIDIAPLALFRILFGFLLAAEGFGAIMTGWVKDNFIIPEYHFGFIAFDWIEPLPGDLMYYYFVLLGVSGLMIMLGYYYRLAIIVYFFLWSGAYLMQKTSYNNHYYLMLLMTFAMIFMPANAAFSFDAKRDKSISSDTCERWCIWFFVFQTFIFYTFASIAKWNPDWIGYNSVELLFLDKENYPIIGSVLTKKWFQMLIAWGGILFDFLIVPILLWKRTRKIGLIIAVFFHIFNSIIFGIGIFPYMALALILFFYSGSELRFFLKDKLPIYNQSRPYATQNNYLKTITLSCLLLWFLIQLILPIRHHFIPGDVNWTEEGHRMSWRMMLRVKSGWVQFEVKDKNTGKVDIIRPEDFVTLKQADRVATRPDFCWQFVQIIKEKYRDSDISIYANGSVSLNGGVPARLFKREYDLAKVDWDPFGHAEWVTLYSRE